jgi:ribonuclease Z
MRGISFPGVAGGWGPAELEAAFGGLTLRGTSVAARATAFAVPELGVTVDLGRLTPAIAAQPVVLLTHAHLDHLSAVLAYLNVRARFHREAPPRLVVPREVAAPLREALRVMPGVDSVRKRLDVDAAIIGVEAGEELALPRGRAACFAVVHGRPALGWRVFRKEETRPAFVFGGDGTTDPFVEDPRLLDARVAVVECTFLEENRRVAARLALHAHLKDWIELAPRLTCDVLLLAHLPPTPRADLERLLAPLAEACACEVVAWAQAE